MEVTKTLSHIHLKTSHQVPLKACTNLLPRTATFIQTSNPIQAKRRITRGKPSSSERNIKGIREWEVVKICPTNQKVNLRKHKYKTWMQRNRDAMKGMIGNLKGMLMMNRIKWFWKISTSVILKMPYWMKRCHNAHFIPKTTTTYCTHHHLSIANLTIYYH